MANTCRTSFFFEDGKYSWTETYYQIGAFANLDVPLINAGVLARLRTMMLPTYKVAAVGIGNGPEMTEARVSFDDTWRDSLVDENTGRGKFGAKYNKDLDLDVAGTSPEVPYSTALCRLEAGGLYRRSLYLSGVPQYVLQDPSGPIAGANAAWSKAFNKFRDELTRPDGPWGFKVALKGGDGNAEKPVVNVAYAPHTFATVEVKAHGFPQFAPDGSQNYVIIRNTVNEIQTVGFTVHHRGANGRWVFSVLDADHIVIAKDWPDSLHYLRNGFARLLKYEVKKITAVKLFGQTHRKRGVRSGRPLGRSRTRT